MTITPAFRPWLWCCAWLTVIWLALLLITLEFWPRMQQVPLISNLEETLQAEAEKTKILAMGDSLLRYALPSPDQFNSMLPDDVFWVQIAFGGKDWSAFAPIALEISQSKLDVILIQDHLLLPRDREIEAPFPVKARMSLSRAVRNFLGLGGKPFLNPEFGVMGPAQRKRKVRQLEKNYSDKLSIASDALEFLKGLKKTSPKVVVFHLPRTSLFESSDAQRLWTVELVETLSSIDIDFVSIGGPLTDDHYYDGAHNNKKGRMVRIEQFRELIDGLQQ